MRYLSAFSRASNIPLNLEKHQNPDVVFEKFQEQTNENELYSLTIKNKKTNLICF